MTPILPPDKQQRTMLHMALLAWRAGDINMIELKAVIDGYATDALVAGIYALHESIMDGGLTLGTEPDQAFNYGRIHHWIDAEISQLTTVPEGGEDE